MSLSLSGFEGTCFRSVPKSTTLDDLERPLCTLLHKTCIFRSLPQKFEQRLYAEFPGERASDDSVECQLQQFSMLSLALTSETLERGRTRSVHDHFGTGGGRFRYSPISVHMLHADSVCTNSVQEGRAISVQFLDHFGTQ